MKNQQKSDIQRNDSLELKIIKVILPLIIYIGISMLVQTAFSFYALKQEFTSMEESDTDRYQLAYHFFDNTSEYIRNYTLIAMFISAVITIVILGIMLKKENKVSSIIIEEIDLQYVILVIGVGVFSSTGFGKLLYLLKLDNVLGSNVNVNQTFLENPLIFQILTLCIVVPVVEELIFRGMIYIRLQEYMDKMYAVIVTAGLFAVYHGNLLQGIYAGILSIFLCFVYEKYENFLAPVILHMAANTTSLVIAYFPVSKFIEEHLLLKIVVMILELTALYFCINYIWKRNEKGE